MGQVVKLSDYRYNILDTEDIPAIPGFGCFHEVYRPFTPKRGPTIYYCRDCGRRMPPRDDNTPAA